MCMCLLFISPQLSWSSKDFFEFWDGLYFFSPRVRIFEKREWWHILVLPRVSPSPPDCFVVLFYSWDVIVWDIGRFDRFLVCGFCRFSSPLHTPLTDCNPATNNWLNMIRDTMHLADNVIRHEKKKYHTNYQTLFCDIFSVSSNTIWSKSTIKG